MSGVGSQGPHPCLVCKDITVQEVIRPVTRGQTYIRCLVCGTVIHFPTPAEGRS